MSLSSEQKFKVVYYLGYSGKTIIADSTNYNSQVADRLNNLSTEIETQVASMLSRLNAADKKLECALDRLAASKIDDITMNPDEIDNLKRDRRRLARELGVFLDIPFRGAGGVNVSVCV